MERWRFHRKSWENHGKIMGKYVKIWENHGKYGKIMENLGKVWEMPWK
jgi:hypothetical protein